MSALATQELAQVVQRADLGATRALARGGTGCVEEVQAGWLPVNRPIVLKRFHDGNAVLGSALHELVRWRRELPAAECARLDSLTTWPLAVVEDRGALAGFVMHRVPEAMTEAIRLPSGRRQRTPREVQYLIAGSPQAQRLWIPEVPPEVRLEVTLAFVEALAFLHEHRIVVGDLSARNVLWGQTPSRVMLVDCDSMSLGGIGSPLPPSFTVDWDDPAQPGLAAGSSDVYKLGLFVLRVLSRSFQTRDPAAADECLEATGRWLLRMSLSADPASRPRMPVWERWAAGRRASIRAAATHSLSTDSGEQ